MTTLQAFDIEKITAHYELTVSKWERLSGGDSNSNYLLQTDQERYVLTFFEEKSLDAIVKLGKVLQILSENHFPSNSLVPLPTEEVTLTYKDKPAILKRYISGYVCDVLDNTMLYQVGETMARLHQIPAPDFLPDQHPYGLPLFRSIIGCQINTKYESWLAGQLQYFEQHIADGLPRALIHGDLYYGNILFDGELKAIIDFEEVCWYYKVFDLGMAIARLCTQKDRLSLSQARTLVMGYQSRAVLEEQEKESLQIFTEYAATAISCWRFWKYNIDTPQASKAGRYQEMVTLAREIHKISPANFVKRIFDDIPNRPEREPKCR